MDITTGQTSCSGGASHIFDFVGRGGQVYDSWDASPGAKVVAGGLVSTRENRLLNWAKEIEALVHEQACR